MALVWFKSIDRIIEEGGEPTEDCYERCIYDQRAEDSLTISMVHLLENSLGPYRSESPHRSFKSPENFSIVNDDYNWYSPWVKMWIPTGFKILRRLL